MAVKIVYLKMNELRNVFILPEGSMRAMCLICNKTVAIVKNGNKEHFY